jgi:two-component system nitrogen regulation response regulator GlnG/two-component system response regulator HydG
MPTGHSEELNESTLPSTGDWEARSPRRDVETLGLVVLWSREEPARIGEILLLPPDDSGTWIFGRGGAPSNERRLSLVRQRPGECTATPPLACRRISRAQLRLAPAGNGAIRVENIGRCALLHLGREVAGLEAAPGDTLFLQNELLFMCVWRALAPPASDAQPLHVHPFGEPDPFGLVGESAALWALRRRIAAVARQPYHVLVSGPSGSGKELVAQAVHALSLRGSKPMVSRNAATIPEGIADAELFGNIRNYPNPGMPERPGLVGQAHESTLFLDEFAELPPGLQAHLLRVLDDGEYQRLGEATTRRADLRLLAATNRPESYLKEDVLARLKVRIATPGLDTRKEDIPLLVVRLLRKHAAADSVALARFFPEGNPQNWPRVSPLLVEALTHHHYTTHVRELDSLLLAAALESRGRYVDLLPDLRRSARSSSMLGEASPLPDAPPRPADPALGPMEQLRLARLRHHRFSPTSCGRDPTYPGNRQTADLHLRQLICRVLHITEWDAGRAADLLAGEDRELVEKATARITRFVENMRARVVNEPESELRRALVDEWKGNATLVLRLVEALREGWMGPSPGLGSNGPVA